ncbi:MAG: NTP transferase domain-containing protein, partial [Candidatus Latescibacteria bacterium]|nr:NTP transferase domain-containing protein [bacterium]MBD3425243.1 NTP transferase domain-containing protein [Candidatus Latescibacterota bacterium]
MYAVILAGGKGRRFWPASSEKRPKQFLSIAGERSMLSITYERLSSFIPPEKIILITVEDQIELARKELPDLPSCNLVAEPSGRNTAPALALAALMVRERSGDEPLLACPADHLITERDNFTDLAVRASGFAADSEILITFGIKPEYAATGYGYIESGGEINGGGGNILEVRRFHEKPERDLAEDYIRRGGFFWNSGIFVWRPSVFLQAWEVYLPSGSQPLREIAGSIGKPEMTRVIKKNYPRLPAISVDYGILEKAENVAVIPGELGWNDVGSWDALYDIHEADGKNNISIGDSEAIDSGGCIFYNPGGFTAAIGVKDIIVVSRDGIVMVCRRGESQKVREIVDL